MLSNSTSTRMHVLDSLPESPWVATHHFACQIFLRLYFWIQYSLCINNAASCTIRQELLRIQLNSSINMQMICAVLGSAVSTTCFSFYRCILLVDIEHLLPLSWQAEPSLFFSPYIMGKQLSHKLATQTHFWCKIQKCYWNFKPGLEVMVPGL